MKITIFPGKYHQNGGFSMAISFREGRHCQKCNSKAQFRSKLLKSTSTMLYVNMFSQRIRSKIFKGVEKREKLINHEKVGMT